MEGMELARKLDTQFISFFFRVFHVIGRVRGYFFPMLGHLIKQRRASKLRLRQEKMGSHIPPFMIFSITRQCNLNCKGCYSKKLHQHSAEDLSMEKMDQIVGEAGNLGISVILLAGGEPLMRREILSVAGKHRKIIFPLFTNGMLINDSLAREIRKTKNILPVISLEGNMRQTDNRRGEGVHHSVMKAFGCMKQNKVLFGASVTVTRSNFDEITEGAFISDLAESGCRVLFLIEYIPCGENSENLVITQKQRSQLKDFVERHRMDPDMIMISFPGDEEIYGGCLAAGRGFFHIGSNGNVEPCPFSPYSDINVKDCSLKEALQSRFLQTLRDNQDLLSEHDGGCALWENREWVSHALNHKEE